MCAGLLVLVALGFTLASSRHRRFYFGAGQTRLSPAPTSAQVIDRQRALIPPVEPRPTPAPSRAASHPPQATLRPAARTAAPGADAGGRTRVPISDAVPAFLPESGPPTGWEVAELEGQATIALVRDEDRLALLVRADRASVILYRDVVVDLRRLPMLAWRWKVTALPAGGDARSPAADDQAAQLYVVVPRWPFPRTSSHVVGYLWDTRAPVGTRVIRPDAPRIRAIVLESGADRAGTWIREQRNVHADYVELFGREPGRVGMVGIMSDSNHTRSHGAALFDDLVFFGSPVNVLDSATSMLRYPRY